MRQEDERNDDRNHSLKERRRRGSSSLYAVGMRVTVSSGIAHSITAMDDATPSVRVLLIESRFASL